MLLSQCLTVNECVILCRMCLVIVVSSCDHDGRRLSLAPRPTSEEIYHNWAVHILVYLIAYHAMSCICDIILSRNYSPIWKFSTCYYCKYWILFIQFDGTGLQAMSWCDSAIIMYNVWSRYSKQVLLADKTGALFSAHYPSLNIVCKWVCQLKITMFTLMIKVKVTSFSFVSIITDFWWEFLIQFKKRFDNFGTIENPDFTTHTPNRTCLRH